ncbi:MAG TPA: RodZ domain-containing protein [Candidatus Angelobacter sp.]|nr:RodZ domain-containing protein [Candidatus Angelobacter sp.]
MGSFGDKLKREREMRGVTLNEISESTKIARRHLEALESEDFASLPGGVFNKGFVRAYARFIGIDEDQAVADYSAINSEAPPPEDQFPLEVHEKPNRELNPRKSQLPMIAAAIALVLVVAGSFMWRSKHHHPGGVLPAVSASIPDASELAQASPEPAQASSQEAHEKSRLLRVREKVARQEQQKQIELASPARRASAPVALTPENSFFVIIKAKEDAWISVMADGRRVSHGILKADRERFVRAARQVIVKTGNAGGIDVYFNGKPLGAIGNESEARTLMFTPAGAAQQ